MFITPAVKYRSRWGASKILQYLTAGVISGSDKTCRLPCKNFPEPRKQGCCKTAVIYKIQMIFNRSYLVYKLLFLQQPHHLFCKTELISSAYFLIFPVDFTLLHEPYNVSFPDFL